MRQKSPGLMPFSMRSQRAPVLLGVPPLNAALPSTQVTLLYTKVRVLRPPNAWLFTLALASRNMGSSCPQPSSGARSDVYVMTVESPAIQTVIGTEARGAGAPAF